MRCFWVEHLSCLYVQVCMQEGGVGFLSALIACRPHLKGNAVARAPPDRNDSWVAGKALILLPLCLLLGLCLGKVRRRKLTPEPFSRCAEDVLEPPEVVAPALLRPLPSFLGTAWHLGDRALLLPEGAPPYPQLAAAWPDMPGAPSFAPCLRDSVQSSY